MIAVASTLTRAPLLNVRTIQERPDGPYRQASFQFATDDLLADGDEHIIEAGPHAFDHEHKLTPLMQQILRQLFGRQESGAQKIIITPGLLTLTYKAGPRFDASFYRAEFQRAADFVDGVSRVLDN